MDFTRRLNEARAKYVVDEARATEAKKQADFRTLENAADKQINPMKCRDAYVAEYAREGQPPIPYYLEECRTKEIHLDNKLQQTFTSRPHLRYQCV
jgi:hypothetical protein